MTVLMIDRVTEGESGGQQRGSAISLASVSDEVMWAAPRARPPRAAGRACGVHHIRYGSDEYTSAEVYDDDE